MSLAFDATRWQKVQEAYRKWWAGDLDRPLVHLTLKGRNPWPCGTRYPRSSLPASTIDACLPRQLPIVGCTIWSAVSFQAMHSPWFCPNFGPGVVAAFLGLELQNGDNTVWFHQPNAVELADIHFTFDPAQFLVPC